MAVASPGLASSRRELSDDPFLSIVLPHAQGQANRAALADLDGTTWRELTYGEIQSAAVRLSDHLLAAGLRPEERVAFLSEPRSEWAIALLGVWRAGGILVPVDVRSPDEDVEAILADSRPRFLLASAGQAERARDRARSLAHADAVKVLDDLLGTEIPSGGASPDPPERGLDDTGFLLYTSGTTGRPKGVAITLGNLAFEVPALLKVFPIHESDVFLSILPPSHLLELVCGLVVPLHAGARVLYPHSLYPENLLLAMQEKGATLMVVVPLFLKLLKGQIERQVRAEGWLRRGLFRAALAVARLPLPSLRRRLFAPVHRRFGGRLRAFISGGARLEPEVGEFFEWLGLPVYEGYGMTETSPVFAVNGPGRRRRGTVGRPLPGVSIRIEEGEILTSGPHVMKGYYRRPEETAQVLEDGWLHTGDLGALDADGFLSITGRMKSLIVLPGGRKVLPEEVEDVLARSPLVKEACVLGLAESGGLADGGEQVAVVVVPADALAQRDDQAVRAEVAREVERLSQSLASYKRPARVLVRRDPLPLTTTRKIKRTLVKAWAEQQESIPA